MLLCTMSKNVFYMKWSNVLLAAYDFYVSFIIIIMKNSYTLNHIYNPKSYTNG